MTAVTNQCPVCGVTGGHSITCGGAPPPSYQYIGAHGVSPIITQRDISLMLMFMENMSKSLKKIADAFGDKDGS